ncbi:hypothetical protein QQ045_028968 [Rhodiola kirilowii]
MVQEQSKLELACLIKSFETRKSQKDEQIRQLMLGMTELQHLNSTLQLENESLQTIAREKQDIIESLINQAIQRQLHNINNNNYQLVEDAESCCNIDDDAVTRHREPSGIMRLICVGVYFIADNLLDSIRLLLLPGAGRNRFRSQPSSPLLSSTALARGGNLSIDIAGKFLHFELSDSSMASQSKPGKLSVYLYIPNIIGYIRVLMNILAFAICFSNKKLFSALYFISFVCDGIDGWCARKFNQVSTFGAVLDMVTDRISTACLLVILSQVYRPGFIFLLLLALDIASHWLQMYSTFLLGKNSHKDVKDSTSWLFRLYYGNRIVMGYCCVACEVLYITLFLLAEKQPESITHVIFTSLKQASFISVLVSVCLFGWGTKQAINVIQMKTAADICVLHDISTKQKE